jgi:hypothetical protein
MAVHSPGAARTVSRFGLELLQSSGVFTCGREYRGFR